MPPASKRKKPAKKSAAKPSRKQATAKRPKKTSAKRASGSGESADHYSDIRRSMQSAILRTLR